jgi:hypothetical protein
LCSCVVQSGIRKTKAINYKNKIHQNKGVDQNNLTRDFSLDIKTSYSPRVSPKHRVQASQFNSNHDVSANLSDDSILYSSVLSSVSTQNSSKIFKIENDETKNVKKSHNYDNYSVKCKKNYMYHNKYRI